MGAETRIIIEDPKPRTKEPGPKKGPEPKKGPKPKKGPCLRMETTSKIYLQSLYIDQIKG